MWLKVFGKHRKNYFIKWLEKTFRTLWRTSSEDQINLLNLNNSSFTDNFCVNKKYGGYNSHDTFSEFNLGRLMYISLYTVAVYVLYQQFNTFYKLFYWICKSLFITDTTCHLTQKAQTYLQKNIQHNICNSLEAQSQI